MLLSIVCCLMYEYMIGWYVFISLLAPSPFPCLLIRKAGLAAQPHDSRSAGWVRSFYPMYMSVAFVPRWYCVCFPHLHVTVWCVCDVCGGWILCSATNVLSCRTRERSTSWPPPAERRGKWNEQRGISPQTRPAPKKKKRKKKKGKQRQSKHPQETFTYIPFTE